MAWRHRFFLSKILSAFFTRSLGHSVHTYLFIATSVPKLIFFTPVSADGRRCHFRFRALANHLTFFLPFPGDSLGLLSISSGHRVQTSVGFHSDLDLLLRPRGIDLDSYSSLNGHSLTASLFKHGGVGGIPYFSPLSCRPRDNVNINVKYTWFPNFLA